MGVLWTQLRDLFFETSECLADVSPPACPDATLSFDGQSVNLHWPTAADAESGIYRYDIYRNGWMLAEVSSGATNFADYGYISGPSVYQVRAVNGAHLESTGCPSLFRNCPAIGIDPATLPNGTIGVAYNQTLSATGGLAPYTYAVTSGSLPNGVTLLSSGVLSGTPAVTGNFPFTVTATDSNGCQGIRAYTIVITSDCIAPDERIYLYMVTRDLHDNPVLHFMDPNQPNEVTGYNTYRSTNPALPPEQWTLMGTNVIDMDEGTPNKQWVDQTGDPGSFYYQVAAYNSACPVEGPW
jgi:hypothetical protein